MDDEAAELEREYQEEKARERAEAERLVGVVLGGKYRVDAFVGGGAMGKVYRATQLLLDKTVAVKVLHAGLGQDEKFQARFHREAKAASKMDHPNSVGVVDFGIERDGTMFIVMEFLAGRDLFHALRNEWPFSTERIVEVMTQVLSALAVAHEQGIVHRDLKPENIMLVPKKQDDGTFADVVKVADFGIAKIMDSHRTGAAGERLSTAGNIAGTPEYMSPEQAQATNIDGRADLYSCGVILYEMCTGKLPFSAETPIGVVLKHITEQPAPPSTINPALSREMEAVIMKSLAKSPADRFADARAMRAALRSTVGMRDMTTASLSASARSAIAAIEAAESAGQASTIVGMSAPVPRSMTANTGPATNAVTVTGTGAPPTTSAPTLTGTHDVATRAETATGLEAPTQPRTPSGPKGDRTHSTTTSHEVPLAAPQAPTPAAPSAPGVSKGTLVSSMVAALAIGALAVVMISKQSGGTNNTSASINAEPHNGAQSPSIAPSISDDAAATVAPTPSTQSNTANGAQDTADAAASDPSAQNGGNEPSNNGNNPSPERGPRSNTGAAPRNSGSTAAQNAGAANTNSNTPTNNAAANNGATPSSTANAATTNTGTTASTNTAAQPPVAAQTTVVNPANTANAATVTTVVHNPAPQPTIAPLSGVRGSFSGLSASGGVLVNRLQGRAQTAADAVARCALNQARAQRAADSFTSSIDVTLNIAVAERRVDRVRLLGGPAWIAPCGREAEPAFSGDLPEADDPEYTITLRVSLSPQR